MYEFAGSRKSSYIYHELNHATRSIGNLLSIHEEFSASCECAFVVPVAALIR